jgi:hypothetical protein
MRGLPIKYRRHAMEKTGAVADEPSTLVFERLKEAVESRMMAVEGAERMDILPEEDALNVQLIQELRQQRLGVHGGALTQQQSPTTDQEVDEIAGQLRNQTLTKTEPAVATRSMPFFNRIRMDPEKLTTLSNQAAAQGPAQGPAQGYGPVPGYKDWQNSTRYPQDSRPRQNFRYPQGSRYPQDSTAFGRPQRDAWGQRGTRGQGLQTCFGCGGSHRFTEHECQGLKDLIQRGFVHLSDGGRLAAGTRGRPGPELPWLGNKGRLRGIKNWLRTYQGADLDRPKKEQTQQRAFHNGVVLQDSDEIWADWEDSYQVRPTDSVTPSQQRPQTLSTLRDSRTAGTTVEPQALPQENVRPGDYVQIISRPADKTAEARKKNESSDPWRRS